LDGAWRLLEGAMLTQANFGIQKAAIFDPASDASVAGRIMPLSQAYSPPVGLYDEMFTPTAGIRPHCVETARRLLQMTPHQLANLRTEAERMLLCQGVTFNVYSEQAGVERIFPFDVMPRIIDSRTWTLLEAGLIQRVKALNAFVADVYKDGHILKDGLIPPDLILESAQYRRGAVGLTQPLDVFISIAGIDLVRGDDGLFRVLEDNVRTPSGVSYALQNRRITAQLMPEVLRSSGVRPIENYPADLLACLTELGAERFCNPTVALLTPGPFNSAFFEHVFLSQQMGIELVEGQDLVCKEHQLWMKTVHGLKRVHVLYRRIDDDFLDPVVFRPDSQLGVAGLSATLRAGNAIVVNAIGTGIADDKAVYAFTPDMIRYYLGEQPLLPIVETFLLRNPEVREKVLRDLDKYVIKPTGASGGYGVVIGPRATDRQLAELRTEIEREPRNYIAQLPVKLSVHPTLVEGADGAPILAPRHIDLRPFILFGAKPRVLAGGLTRVALREGALIVNSSQGGGSKDTWVIGAPC
jgi:uncharacterized circularly permuted ATP-grasp superfamily protein